MASIPLPAADYLRQRLSYDENTGVLRWRGGHAYAGKPITGKSKGYLTLGIDGRKYTAHRVIWKMMTGADPTHLIDHRNGDRIDNRWNNLREATNRQNLRNNSGHPDRSLPRGVYRAPRSLRFFSMIYREGKRTFLGTFDTPGEASAAFHAAAEKVDGEFYRPKK